MVTGVLFLMLALLVALLAAFIYQIVTTPLTAVDAPTLARSRAESAAPPVPVPAPVLPARQPPAHASPAATGPIPAAFRPGASHRLRSQAAVTLAIAGVAAIVIGGFMFRRIAQGTAVCAHQVIEVCSQGFVLLTGAQLAGGAIALAGICSVVVASVLALR